MSDWAEDLQDFGLFVEDLRTVPNVGRNMHHLAGARLNILPLQKETNPALDDAGELLAFVVVHGFTKKIGKTPAREIRAVRQRQADFLARQGG